MIYKKVILLLFHFSNTFHVSNPDDKKNNTLSLCFNITNFLKRLPANAVRNVGFTD